MEKQQHVSVRERHRDLSLEASDEVELMDAKLASALFDGAHYQWRARVTADRRWVEKVFVVVAKDEVVTAFVHYRQDFAWSGTEGCDIPKASDLIDASLTNVLEHSAKS